MTIIYVDAKNEVHRITDIKEVFFHSEEKDDDRCTVCNVD